MTIVSSSTSVVPGKGGGGVYVMLQLSVLLHAMH